MTTSRSEHLNRPPVLLRYRAITFESQLSSNISRGQFLHREVVFDFRERKIGGIYFFSCFLFFFFSFFLFFSFCIVLVLHVVCCYAFSLLCFFYYVSL